MADGDAALHAMGDGLPRRLVEMPPARVEVEIEVEVEILAEVLRHGEDPRDMPLDGADRGDGAPERAVGVGGAVEHAGLVEVQMAVGEAAQDPPAAGVEHWCLAGDLRRDGGDVAVPHADIHGRRAI
jgi:hypothetical protein